MSFLEELMKKSYLLTLCVFCLTSASTPAFAAKKCKDFKTQQAAQVFYEMQKKAGKTGWKSLDRDGDGRACDCNPGGSNRNCPAKRAR